MPTWRSHDGSAGPVGGGACGGHRFWKMHGAGNDFVVLDLTRHGPPAPELCRALADRHTGVGCDMILGVGPPRTRSAVASFHIWTAAGEASSQCGNGARCVALWLRLVGGVRADRFVLDSPNATHAVSMEAGGAVRISFGRADQGAARRVVLEETSYDYAPVWVGNPHAVIRVPDVAHVPLDRLGPLLQDPVLGLDPRANVGAVGLVDRGTLDLRVFEFGAGETQACGSGACAAAEVMMNAGLVDDRVQVRQRGGTLTIERRKTDAELFMTGPAALVFEGRTALPSATREEAAGVVTATMR